MRTLMIGLVCGLLSLPMAASAAVHKSAHAKRATHGRMVKHAKAKSKHGRTQHASRTARSRAHGV